MDDFTVEKGPLSGGYKTLKKFDGRKPGSHRAARIAYDMTEIKEGQRKRLRQGRRIIDRESCYWT